MFSKSNLVAITVNSALLIAIFNNYIIDKYVTDYYATLRPTR